MRREQKNDRHFKTRNLFSGVGTRVARYQLLREFVADKICELAKAGDLSVTELQLQLPPFLADTAGHVILHRASAGGYESPLHPADYPPELQSYRVRVVSIPAHVQVDKPNAWGRMEFSRYEIRICPVEWTRAKYVTPDRADDQLRMQQRVAATRDKRGADPLDGFWTHELVEYDGATDVEVDLMSAWLMLRQRGLGVAYRNAREPIQLRNCRMREVGKPNSYLSTAWPYRGPASPVAETLGVVGSDEPIKAPRSESEVKKTREHRKEVA